MALIIKSLSVDPPNYDELSDDENDYVKDPAQHRDQLPQPYRMIDSLLSLFVDEVWEEITARNTARIAEKSKVRPPRYECSLQLQNPIGVKYLTTTQDGRYIFAACPGEISLINAASKNVLSVYEDDKLDIISLECIIIGIEIYLLMTIDELGMCRVFGCAVEQIFLIKVMNDETFHSNYQAVKCGASADGDFIGVVMESASSNDVILEVYQLPRDIWLKEIEDIKTKLLADGGTKGGANKPHSPLPAESLNPMVSVADQREVAKGDNEDMDRKSTDSVGSRKGINFKFSASLIVMRQHAPEKLTANSGLSPAMSLAQLSDPKIMGTGQGHLLTRAYLEIRKEAFNELHKSQLVYRSPESKDNLPVCNFHFFLPGMVIPYGMEQPGALKKPSCIGMWWSGSRQFIFYCLTKPVKAKKPSDTGDADLDIKPEAVWPQSDVITASASSSDTNLIAIGLANGIVTIWDKHLGQLRKCVNICNSSICSVLFLDPSICPQDNNPHECYPTSSSCYALIRCKNSSLYKLNCGMYDYSSALMISDKALSDDAHITTTIAFPKMSEIILRVHKDGSMFLQDALTTVILCEVALPKTHTLSVPWEPVIAMGAFGQMLYLKGAQKHPEDNYVVENTMDSLFVFQLRSFPTLDAYWMKHGPDVPFITSSSIDIRCNALLSQRVKASGERQARLQQKWPNMKLQLLRTLQIKSH